MMVRSVIGLAQRNNNRRVDLSLHSGHIILIPIEQVSAIKLVSAASRSKSKDRLDGNQDNMSSRETCLPADCCFIDTAL
jgi:hypothetical protein